MRQEPAMLEWELLDKERKQSYTAIKKEKYLTTPLKQKSNYVIYHIIQNI